MAHSALICPACLLRPLLPSFSCNTETCRESCEKAIRVHTVVSPEAGKSRETRWHHSLSVPFLSPITASPQLPLPLPCIFLSCCIPGLLSFLLLLIQLFPNPDLIICLISLVVAFGIGIPLLLLAVKWIRRIRKDGPSHIFYSCGEYNASRGGMGAVSVRGVTWGSASHWFVSLHGRGPWGQVKLPGVVLSDLHLYSCLSPASCLNMVLG